MVAGMMMPLSGNRWPQIASLRNDFATDPVIASPGGLPDRVIAPLLPGTAGQLLFRPSP